jgi:hypothetical protein
MMLRWLLVLAVAYGWLGIPGAAINAPSESPTESPTASPTEHATYVDDAVGVAGLYPVMDTFHGPYELYLNAQIFFYLNATACNTGKYIYIYLDVSQGNADLVVNNNMVSQYAGSDYIELACESSSKPYLTSYVVGSFDYNTVASVYNVATLFQFYYTISSSKPYRSPFDSLAVVNHLYTNGTHVDVFMEYGSYSYFKFDYDDSNPVANLYVKTADMSDSSFQVYLLVAVENRIPRLYDLNGMDDGFNGLIEQTIILPLEKAANSYHNVFSFSSANPTIKFCADMGNCTIMISFLNLGGKAVSLDVSISNTLIVPGVAYGPFSRLSPGRDHFFLKNFCLSTGYYAHIFVEAENGDPYVYAGETWQRSVSSEYIVYNAAVCPNGQHLNIGVESNVTDPAVWLVYKVEVLVRTTMTAIASPFDSSETVVQLSPNVMSDVVDTGASFFFLKFPFVTPSALWTFNYNTDDSLDAVYVVSCFGSRINRPTTVTNRPCEDTRTYPNITRVNAATSRYALMWNIDYSISEQYCADDSNCTVYLTGIVLTTNTDDVNAHVPCTTCGLHFILTTQDVNNFGALHSVPPIATPTANPTSPTKKPTHKPTSSPTVHPSRPTVAPTAIPSTHAQPTLTPTAAPTAIPSTHAQPTFTPTAAPTPPPTASPTSYLTATPTIDPTTAPTTDPTTAPTTDPTTAPTTDPTTAPTTDPTTAPTIHPTTVPTRHPTITPTADPTAASTSDPTTAPTPAPSVVPSAKPTTPPSANPTEIEGPTAPPTEHATYVDDLVGFPFGGFGVVMDTFYGPYELGFSSQIYLYLDIATCDTSKKIYFYLEVSQGNADVVVGNTGKLCEGSDYVEVDCSLYTGTTILTAYVTGAFDYTVLASVYNVATLFKFFYTISASTPYQSPFDSLAVVNHLYANGSHVDVFMEYGSYAYFKFDYDESNPTANLYLKTADMSDDSFYVVMLVAVDSRIPRLYDITDGMDDGDEGMIHQVIISPNEYAANSYLKVFSFGRASEPIKYCQDMGNCTVMISFLNLGGKAVSLDVSISSTSIVPGVAYGPFSRLSAGWDHFYLENFCISSGNYAHIFVEAMNGDPSIFVGYALKRSVSSEYIVFDPAECLAGQQHLNIAIGSNVTDLTVWLVYKVKVLLRTSGSLISSPFDSSHTIVHLTPDVMSDFVHTGAEFFYLKFEYVTPSALWTVNYNTDDVIVDTVYVVSCMGSSINRPIAVTSHVCEDMTTLPNITRVNAVTPKYAHMWNIDSSVASTYCADVSNCTLYLTGIVLTSNTDDVNAHVSCRACGLHFILTTQDVNNFGAVHTLPPIATPTANPTCPTRKPTHKPTSHPTIRPTHPTPPPTTVPSEWPTAIPTPGPTADPSAAPVYIDPDLPVGECHLIKRIFVWVDLMSCCSCVAIAVTDLAGHAGIAGYADGVGTNAFFNFPSGACSADTIGTIYVSDMTAITIRRVSSSGEPNCWCYAWKQFVMSVIRQYNYPGRVSQFRRIY